MGAAHGERENEEQGKACSPSSGPRFCLSSAHTTPVRCSPIAEARAGLHRAQAAPAPPVTRRGQRERHLLLRSLPPTARAPKLTSAVAERPPARDKSTTSRHITGHAAARRCRREDTGRGCPRASAAGSLAPSPHPLWPASRRPHRPPRAAAPLPEALTAGNALGRGRHPPALLRPPPRTSAAAPWRCTPAPPEAAASQVRRSGAGRGRGTCAAFRRVPTRTTSCSAMVPGWGGPAPLPPARRTPG